MPKPVETKAEPVEEKVVEVQTKPVVRERAPGKVLSEQERRKAMAVAVPSKGVIPTPFIDWNNIPERCKMTGITYYDHPTPEHPGMLPWLYEMFALNRKNQDFLPTNLLIMGPPGSGKTELVRKFAQDAQLPYWGVMGTVMGTSEELLGKEFLITNPDGTQTNVFKEGIIPQAVRAGGILHIDEPNVIDPSILMRLDELMDNKRQIDMSELTGNKNDVIKAHPDLFIIFTMNPPTYEGVKPLPDPIVSRLTYRAQLDYPTLNDELKIVKAKCGLRDADLKGRMGKDVMDFMQFVENMRRAKLSGESISIVPSVRETQAFITLLQEGYNWDRAFNVVIGAVYWDPTEKQNVENAKHAIGR